MSRYVLLAVAMLFYTHLLRAQCSGFWASVDTDPPYLNYCPGDTVAAFPIITGGTAPFSYQWSTGGTDSIEILTALENGWYSACVTITDANGCATFGCKHIKPTFWNLTGWVGFPQCEGEEILLTVSEGPPNTFLWSTGETTSSIMVNQPGTYTVTISNPTYGCEEVMEFTPTFLPLPEPEITGPAEICFGLTGTLEVANSSQYTNYTWGPNGESTSTIEIDTAGTYTVTVTDFNGCVGTTEFTVEHLFGTLPDLSAPPQLCLEDAGTVAVLNSSDLATFAWSTGATTPSIIGTAPNTYYVTVTDLNGCVEYGEISIELFETTDPEIAGDGDICFGQESVMLGVNQSYSGYAWSTGEMTQSIETTDPGTYTVTVTDDNGCTTTGEHVIDDAPIPDPYIQIPPQTCDSIPTLLTVYGSGGPFVSYLWSPDGQTTSEIVVYESGIFSVHVTNDYGCVATTYEEAVYIGNGPDVEIVLSQLSCNGEVTLTALGGLGYAWSTGENTQTISITEDGIYSVTVTDENGCTGSAQEEVTTTGGLVFGIDGPETVCDGDTVFLSTTSGFTGYEWSNGAGTPGTEVWQPGTYSVTVTEAGGCTGEASITIEAAPEPQPDISGPDGICDGGTATLQLNESYTSILWSTGDAGQVIDVSSGTYSVTVTNSEGCTGSDEITVNTFPPATVGIAGPASICTGSLGTLSVSGPYAAILWNTGETLSEISVSEAGLYSVTVTDNNGCTATDSLLLETGSGLTPEVILSGTPCSDSMILDAGVGYDAYVWSSGDTASSIMVTSSGNYQVTVSDGTGCTGSAEATVEIQEPVNVEIAGPGVVCGAETGVLTATPGFELYAWSTGDTSASVTVSQTGNYQVIVTDAGGCTGVASIDFEIFENPEPVISGPASICTGSTAVLSVAGSYSEISWSTGSSSPEVSVPGDGMYIVTVTDVNGCTGTSTHTVQVADSLSLEISVTGDLCNNQAVLSAGLGFESYTWSTGATTSDVSVTQDGSYAVTVTDDGGCSGQAGLQLEFPEPPSVNISGPDAACGDTLVMLTATSSTSTYLWSTGDTTQTIQVGDSGDYVVTVTDSNGCTAESSQTFEALPLPNITITGPDFICNGQAGFLFIEGTYADVTWSTGTSGDSLLLDGGGEYEVIVTDANGCTATAGHTVTEGQRDSTFMEMETCSVLDTGTVQYVMSSQSGCDSVITIHMMLAPTLNNTVTLSACSGETAEFDGVEIPAGMSREFLYISGSGCDSVVTVNVTAMPAVEFEVELFSACAGVSDGVAEVLILQGSAPFLVSMDGGAGQEEVTLAGLSAGSHVISVMDDNGCVLDMPVDIPERTGVEIMVEDQVLTCASPSVVLQPTILSGNADDVSWHWSTGAIQPQISVDEPGRYSVIVDDGCGEREYTIGVSWASDNPEGDLFYVPNVFTPNRDGINDRFRAYPNADLNVLDFEFRIFDRWGNQLFGATTTEAAWDGVFHGSQMDPGVYVWYLKANVDLCGQREQQVIRKGDVTVMR